MLALGTCVATVVMYRTWRVAGMPTIGPEQLVSIWRALGMQLEAPVGTLKWTQPQDWSTLPVVLWGWIVEPSRLSLLQIGWPGNVWLWLLVAAFIAGGPTRRPSGSRALLWVVPLVGLAMLLGIRFMNLGGDGNYFIAPVVLATIAGCDLAWRRGTVRTRAAILGSLPLFVLFHAAYSFVSADWGVGTRRFDLDFSRSNRDSVAFHEAKLAAASLTDVGRFLRNTEPRPRVAGSVEYLGYLLPVRYEPLYDLYIAHLNPKPGADADELKRLLRCGGTDAFLIQSGAREPHVYPEMERLYQSLAAVPESYDLYRDAHWRLIDLHTLLPPCEQDE
jgi:hypothetical protein